MVHRRTRGRRFGVLAATLAFVAGSVSSAFPGAATRSHTYLDELFATGRRRAGSQSAEDASEYIRNKFSEFGYQPVVQEFFFPYYRVDEKSLTLADGTRYEVEEFMYSGSTSAQGITAEVVEPNNDWSNVAGKIVFLPLANADPGWKNLSNTLKDDYAHAVTAGAAGVIAEATDRLYAASVSRATWRMGAIPGLVVKGARDLIGKSARMILRSEIVRGTGRNVIAHREGPGDETILVMAHYDAWFGGASDNGSGTAALLRAAELLAGFAPARDVDFVAVDGEELGLLGSQEYVTTHDVSTIAGVVNLDMVSSKPSDVYKDAPVFQWRVLMTTETPPLIAAVEKGAALNAVAGAPLPATAWEDGYGSFRTDYEWLYYQGVPGTWIVSEAAYYHTPDDTPDQVDAVDLENVSSMVAGIVRDMQTMPLARVLHLGVTAVPHDGSLSISVNIEGSPRPGAAVTVTGYRDHAAVSATAVTDGGDGTYSAAVPVGDHIRIQARWNTLDGEVWISS